MVGETEVRDLFDFSDVETIDVRADEIPLSQPVVEEAGIGSIIASTGGQGMFTLRVYQHAIVDAFFASVNRVLTTLIVMATGLGKTVVAAEIAIRWPQTQGRVLFVAHTEELIDQAAEKIGLHLDQTCGIEMGDRREAVGSKRSLAKVLVASVQTLAREKRRGKFNPKDFSLIIFDECFIPGTLIDGRPIESIDVGDVVSCFDHQSSKIVFRNVTETSRKRCNSLIRIVADDGRIIVCTPNHPVFTLNGYVRADILSCGEMMLTTEKDIRDADQADDSPRCERKGVDVITRFGVEAYRARRERDGWKSLSRFGAQLQNSATRGREEGSGVKASRVASIEILKPGSDGEFERLCPKGFVYNFGVEEHHNYFANGILVHNCHHSTSASYRQVAEYFLAGNPRIRIAGLTATPERSDGKALGDMYRECCADHGLIWGIENGWLVGVKQKIVEIDGLSFAACRTTAGDLNEKDLESVMMGVPSGIELEDIQEQEAMLHKVAKPVIEEASGRPTMIFCVTCEHATKMAEVCNRYPGTTAEVVTGTTPKDRRLDIINKFRAGVIQILCVVAIGVEGFDARVDVVAIAKPTKAKNRYLQMLGRGTRPLPRTVDGYDTPEERLQRIAVSVKPFMTVMDFVGIAGKHQLISSVDVLAGEYEEDVIEAAKLRLREGNTEDVQAALEASKEEIEAKKRAKIERERLKKERDDAERMRRFQEAERRKHIQADVMFRTKEIPLERVVIPTVIGQGMYRGGASDKQVRYLMQLGIGHKSACAMNGRQAGAVISKRDGQTGPHYIMRKGKYMGQELKDIPRGYMEYFIANCAPHPECIKAYETMKSSEPLPF